MSQKLDEVEEKQGREDTEKFSRRMRAFADAEEKLQSATGPEIEEVENWLQDTLNQL